MVQETKKFDAEVGKVLKLMIHSLYTNKEIFIRELISNSSDACDKLRYLSQTDPSLIEGDSDFKIIISLDKDAKTITVRDNGIGMNQEDLMDNLGTIASSGTQRFMSQLSGDSKKDSQLIGQFGVGFYSCFMVADKITVTSRKAGSSDVFVWESDGHDEYSIASSERMFNRGTEIVLHIKPEESEFLDLFKIRYIVKNYSDHIAVPICLIGENSEEEQLNSSSALWMRSKNDITEEQYNEFYRTVSYGADQPWITLHNHNEGAVEFTNLLFIPSTKTFDLFHPDRKCRVKLYVKRVFIADENIDIIPRYLRFLRGVIDSDDLPLNISRETLQHNAILEKIKKSVTKRVLSEIKKQQERDFDSYLKFWNNFGAAFKEGLCEFDPEQEKILDACVFHSALNSKMITLDQYIENHKLEGDGKVIYYLSGDNAEKLRHNPKIEGFLKKNIDVLLFTDPVDDFWVNVNGSYKGYEIKSVTRSDIDLDSGDLDQDKSKTEEEAKNAEPVLEYFKKELGDLVKEVKLSRKLASSPACLAVAQGAMDIRMERYLLDQKQLTKSTAKILEINLEHPLVNKIARRLNDDVFAQENSELVHLIYDQACIIEGEPVADVGAFAKRLNAMLGRL